MASETLTLLAEKITKSSLFLERFSEIQLNAGKTRLSFETGQLASEKISKLLLQGSLLALSNNIYHRSFAQKINALLYETKIDDEAISIAIQVLTSRLGNFPVISESFEIFGDGNLMRLLNSDTKTSRLLDLEIIGSLFEEEEASRVQIKDKKYYFNLYQQEILNQLSTKQLISFSAPTSFGKSYIVRHHIARKFESGNLKRVLILVPTKSLIDDFHEGMLNLKQELGLDYSIYTHARLAETASEKNVFILTQERLSFLIEENPEFVRTFEIVYCDEAQYISRGYRGFVLRRVLKQLVNLCKAVGENGENGTQYIFSSPLIKNPEYYQEKFFEDLDRTKCFHQEVIFSPVEKNLHIISKSTGGFSFFLLKDSPVLESFEERLEEIGKREFPLLLRTEIETPKQKIDRNVFTVLDSKLGGRTILYTTSPIKAHEYAYSLAEMLQVRATVSATVYEDLSRYIKDHYDESFGLLDLVKKGIGLHYGKMPIGLRREMVRLFEAGHIDYLICTSTLLEGVNLPAKNIFVFSDKQNGSEKHSTLSFWNLIGRAGRITYGLSGNVFCVSDNSQTYKELFDETTSEINDPELQVSKNKTRQKYVVTSFFDSEKIFDYVRSNYRNDIEYLIFELLTSEYFERIVDQFNLKADDKNRFIELLRISRESIAVPIDFLKKNPGIDPRLQNDLLNYFKAIETNELLSYLEITLKPLSIGQQDLRTILEKTAVHLMWPHGNVEYDFVGQLANRITQWLHESSISEFVQQVLRHHKDKPVLEKIDKALNVIAQLDTDVAFNSPKYMKCFFDLLLSVLSGRMNIDTKIFYEKIEGFLFAIESGVSSNVGRYLFEKGVSRPIAIKVNDLVSDLVTSDVNADFFNSVRVLEALQKGLSKLAFNELIEHLKS